MERKRYWHYRNLLKQYFVLSWKHNGDNASYMKLQDEVLELADNDSEFALLLFQIDAEYQVQGTNRWTCLHIFREFSESTPVEPDDTNLLLFGDLYQHDPIFQKWCREDKTLQPTLTYWLEEYHRRIANDERFAKRVLLRKLARFTLGALGLETPVEFDEAERNLFIRSYHSDATFRTQCNNHNVIVREAIASWLKERQQRESEDKDS